MIRDFGWGGMGGGGWSLLQHEYQSQEYFVRFIHNHYLQVLLDVGVIGFVLWMAQSVFIEERPETGLDPIVYRSIWLSSLACWF